MMNSDDLNMWNNEKIMNHCLHESPLAQTPLTKEKMEQWVQAQKNGGKVEIDVYGKPSEKQLRQLENVRSLSRELQDNLQEIESTVRIADRENRAMNPTAPILDYSEDHEFMSVDIKAEEDEVTARAEEKRRLTKDGRVSLKASRVIEKVVL